MKFNNSFKVKVKASPTTKVKSIFLYQTTTNELNLHSANCKITAIITNIELI